MKEIIIIETQNGKKVKQFLDQEHESYEVYYENAEEFPTDDKLLQEYREAWQNPQRLAEAKQWEQAAMTDWTERAKKDKK